MTQVLIAYGPDEDCVDPADPDQKPRRHVDVIEGDAFVVWHEQVGDPDGDGHTNVHLWGSGVFENLTLDDLRRVLESLGMMP